MASDLGNVIVPGVGCLDCVLMPTHTNKSLGLSLGHCITINTAVTIVLHCSTESLEFHLSHSRPIQVRKRLHGVVNVRQYLGRCMVLGGMAYTSHAHVNN